MVPFIRTMNGMKVDVVEVVYLKENPGAATASDSHDAVCRLCLKRDRCVDLNVFSKNFADDILAKCIPEVDIKSTRDPKICLSCQTSLLKYYQFVTECLAKQENIMECDDQEAIKSEELDIKTEEEECDGNTGNGVSLINSSVMSSESTEIKSFVDISNKQETNHKSVNWDPNQNGNEIKLEYTEDHKLIEDMTVTPYHCYLCPYVTKQKRDLSQHLLIHQKSPRIRTYDCSLCSYKTKYKANLTTHMLIHKDISEVTTYDCSFCSYKTKRRSDLTKHMLIHKDISEVTTYDCNFCSYKAKRKIHLTLHLLIHQDASKDTSEVITYDCDHCSYNTKWKGDLTKHILIHKDISEVKTYQCALCPYKAKQKSSLKTHLAKRKSHLTEHLLVHKDASKRRTYHCKLCPYKAKFKYSLTSHMLTHQKGFQRNDSQFCSFKAKQKSCLNDHVRRIYRDASEATTYHAIESNRKYLTSHVLTHRDVPSASENR
ncbi:hypothetical protein NQ318_010694 [Aromia moschata]|uniref:Uncharacterized protein n=1 Tax=Aromia moschata TaxID=1265417 RepID=A0AAV8XNL7_9CUCU|nr:hypothetical protein NQ318_010694 [Aromia moschata]